VRALWDSAIFSAMATKTGVSVPRRTQRKELRTKWQAFERDYVTSLELKSTGELTPCEPNDWLLTYDGEIILSDEGGQKTRAGSFRVVDAQAEAVGNAPDGPSFVDVLDAESSELEEFCGLLSNDGGWSDAIERALMPSGVDLTIFLRLDIDPKWRGNGLGLVVLNRLVEIFGHGGVAALKPFPPQFSGCTDPGWKMSEDVPKEWRNQLRSLSSLREYYGRIGFIPIPRTNLMALSTANGRPSLEEALSGRVKRRPHTHRNG